jgi:hypothetical protein
MNSVKITIYLANESFDDSLGDALSFCSNVYFETIMLINSSSTIPTECNLFLLMSGQVNLSKD